MPETSINPPLIEAVILGNYGAKSISFISRGENRLQYPAIFLASNASSYVTGHNLVVDGGYCIK